MFLCILLYIFTIFKSFFNFRLEQAQKWKSGWLCMCYRWRFGWTFSASHGSAARNLVKLWTELAISSSPSMPNSIYTSGADAKFVKCFSYRFLYLAFVPLSINKLFLEWIYQIWTSWTFLLGRPANAIAWEYQGVRPHRYPVCLFKVQIRNTKKLPSFGNFFTFFLL